MAPECVYRGFYLPLKFEQGAPFLRREAGSGSNDVSMSKGIWSDASVLRAR
jgi:hypothetical protein